MLTFPIFPDVVNTSEMMLIRHISMF